MPRLKLLDDQPANTASDKLNFERYLNALKRTVLDHDTHNIAPLVVGIFSPWGSGKSTLLTMLEEELQYKPDAAVGELENSLREQQGLWVTVKFSPWMYRNEKSLLLPLLATLAKNQPVFEQLIQTIVKSGPGLVKKLTGTLIDASTTGLPLLTFLDSVQKDKENAKDLQEKIAEAVRTVTGDDKRLVFLIDDLDRCHDSKQIVNLLEQIKLFLHLPRCLFFIAADRKHIVDAINIEFPNAGEEYLEKFVQVSFNLPPIQSQHLVEVLGIEDKEKKDYRSLCEALGNNPRRIKQVWNEAVLALEVREEEWQRVDFAAIRGKLKKPELSLMLKWLLLKSCGELKANPYRYFEFEKAGKKGTSRDEFIKALGFKDDKNEWHSEEQRRLAVYLWNDLDSNRFEHSNAISLYAYACNESSGYVRGQIEEGCFDGGARSIFKNRDFSRADLSGGNFQNATFENCYFVGANFSHAKLSGAQFIQCDIEVACFDDTDISGTIFNKCQGLSNLIAKPGVYEQIADATVAYWQSLARGEREQWDRKLKAELPNSYLAIIALDDKATLTEADKKRLNDKEQAIRAELQA